MTEDSTIRSFGDDMPSPNHGTQLLPNNDDDDDDDVWCHEPPDSTLLSIYSQVAGADPGFKKRGGGNIFDVLLAM